MFAVPTITSQRVGSDGSYVRPQQSLGMKWSVVSVFSVLATIAVTICAIAALVLGSLALASGIAIPAAVIQFSAALFCALVAAQLIHITSECIKTARHHLSPTNTLI